MLQEIQGIANNLTCSCATKCQIQAKALKKTTRREKKIYRTTNKKKNKPSFFCKKRVFKMCFQCNCETGFERKTRGEEILIETELLFRIGQHSAGIE